MADGISGVRIGAANGRSSGLRGRRHLRPVREQEQWTASTASRARGAISRALLVLLQ